MNRKIAIEVYIKATQKSKKAKGLECKLIAARITFIVQGLNGVRHVSVDGESIYEL